MSLAQFFYAKETIRERVRQWRQACSWRRSRLGMKKRRAERVLRQRRYRDKDLTVGFPSAANRFVDPPQDIRGVVARAAFDADARGDILKQSVIPSDFPGNINARIDDSSVAVFATFIRPEPVRPCPVGTFSTGETLLQGQVPHSNPTILYCDSRPVQDDRFKLWQGLFQRGVDAFDARRRQAQGNQGWVSSAGEGDQS